MINQLLLLSLRSPFLDDSKIYVPMANLYLKGYLNQYAPDTEVILGDDDYDPSNLNLEGFQAVGLSIMTPQREEANKLAKAIKSKYPNIKIIAGGPHVKNYKDDMVPLNFFDYVVPYDGERPLTRICLGTETNRIPLDVMTKQDIATAPRPDRTSKNAIDVINRYNYTLGDRKATTMMTSRGCPMTCTFCEDARTQPKWSGLENLCAEMDDIVNLGFKGVYLFDDLFAIAMPTVRPICEELKKRDLIYRCNGQARYFTKWGEDFAKMLADTGCYEIAFGHESGNQRILDNVNKRTTVEQNYLSVNYAKKYGFVVKSYLMLGLPGEDLKTIADTERFIQTAGIDDFQLSIYYPYRGTQIRDGIEKGQG